jgi:hypothetical protein
MMGKKGARHAGRGHAGREGSLSVEIGDKARIKRVTVHSSVVRSSHWGKEILWQGVSAIQ